MDNNITQKDIVMFKIDWQKDCIKIAMTKNLMHEYYEQFNGMLDLAKSLDIISLEEYTSTINEVHSMMAKKIVKEGWN